MYDVKVSSPATVLPKSNQLSLYQRLGSITVFVVAAGLSIRFYWVVIRYSVNLFFFDEWDIYEGLFRGWPWWRLFLQEHGPHRQGVGVVVVTWLLRATHWDSRVQAYAIATAIVLAMLLGIVLKVRFYGPLQFFDIIIPVIFLGLGQWEVLLSAPGPSPQAFPLLLLTAYCLAWLQTSALCRYVGVVVLNFLLVFTGYGVFVAPLTLLLLFIECWLLRAEGKSVGFPLTASIVCALSLGAFFVGYKFSPAADCYEFPYHNLLAYPQFMGLMFAKFLGIKRGMIFPALVGIGVVVLLLIILLRSILQMLRLHDRKYAIIVILSGYTLLYAMAAAIGRVCLGAEAAKSSRNATLLIPGFLALYFAVLTIPLGRKRTFAMAALLLAVLPSCIQRYHKEIEGFSAMKQAWKKCYLVSESVSNCDAVSRLQLLPQPSANHLPEKLIYLKKNHLNLYADAGK